MSSRILWLWLENSIISCSVIKCFICIILLLFCNSKDSIFFIFFPFFFNKIEICEQTLIAKVVTRYIFFHINIFVNLFQGQAHRYTIDIEFINVLYRGWRLRRVYISNDEFDQIERMENENFNVTCSTDSLTEISWNAWASISSALWRPSAVETTLSPGVYVRSALFAMRITIGGTFLVFLACDTRNLE